jgi:hypothetical protein
MPAEAGRGVAACQRTHRLGGLGRLGPGILRLPAPAWAGLREAAGGAGALCKRVRAVQEWGGDGQGGMVA